MFLMVNSNFGACCESSTTGASAIARNDDRRWKMEDRRRTIEDRRRMIEDRRWKTEDRGPKTEDIYWTSVNCLRLRGYGARMERHFGADAWNGAPDYARPEQRRVDQDHH